MAKRVLRILGLVLRVAVCLPLTFLFLAFLLLVLSWWYQDPLGWVGSVGLLLTALTFGGVYGLVGLWGSLFLEGSPMPRGLRRVIAAGLVVGMVVAAPWCVTLWSDRGGWDQEGLFWIFLGPVLVGVYQLLRLFLGPRSPAVRSQTPSSRHLGAHP